MKLKLKGGNEFHQIDFVCRCILIQEMVIIIRAQLSDLWPFKPSYYQCDFHRYPTPPHSTDNYQMEWVDKR